MELEHAAPVGHPSQAEVIEDLEARCAGLEERCAAQDQHIAHNEEASHQAHSLAAQLEHERQARSDLECQLEAVSHDNARLKILAMDSQEKADELEGTVAQEVVARIHAEDEQCRLGKQRDQLDSELSFLVEEIAVMKEAMMCI
eukprot:TRINITY_DN52556_c0_g1_i1.p1 TRINITY_DN52556_c0_g1~~TRINITY_DN52556_c0_g1_i1.p1  ORF type:complete len:144 (+),score=38.74 TRINITY_DN52556_c0_g1_i1:211-642(+)